MFTYTSYWTYKETYLGSHTVLVVREVTQVLLQGALSRQELDVRTIVLDLTVSLLGDVLVSVQGRETPLFRDDNLLLARELVSGSSQTLDDGVLVAVLGTGRHDNLTNQDTGSETMGLTPRTSHTLLQSIGTSARQHLVDTQNVEGVYSDPQVERISTRYLGDVLVGANTCGFEGLGGQLLQLVGNEVHAQGELIDGRLFTAEIVDTNLGVGHRSVVARLGVGLVLAVPVAASGSSSHGVWLMDGLQQSG